MGKGLIFCSRVYLTIFNIIQFLSGLLLIIAGVLIKTTPDKIESFSSSPEGGYVYPIVIGCALIVISIIGCIGNYKLKFPLLVAFCTLTGIIMLLDIIALIGACVIGSQLPEASEIWLNKKITQHDTKEFEAIQRKFSCCGVEGPNDWSQNPNYKDGNKLPPSCCIKETTPCLKTVIQESPKDYPSLLYYNDGCRTKFSKSLQQPLWNVIGVFCVCLFVLILTLTVAVYLTYKVKGS